MVGAIDVASHAIETPEEVAATLRKALAFVDADKLYPSTNCGMAPLPRRRDRQTARLKRRCRDRSPRAGGKIRRTGFRALLPVNLLSGPLPAQRQVAASGRQIARRATALHNGNSASRSRG